MLEPIDMIDILAEFDTEWDGVTELGGFLVDVTLITMSVFNN